MTASLESIKPLYRNVKKSFKKFAKSAKRPITIHNLQKRILRQHPLKIVIGANNIYEEGWIPTEIDTLNLLKERDWERLFGNKKIDAIMAEHVWEHLYLEDAIIAAKMCFKYLKYSGHIRAAVPDKYHPDPIYRERVKVGGSGPSADDHKMFYSYNSFKKVFELAGFKVDLLEYFNESGEFVYKDWNPKDGFIRRSKRFDERNKDGKLIYTSVILDAYKI